MVVGEALRRGGGSCFPEHELLAQTEDEEIQTLEMLSCRQSRQEALQILTWRPIKWDFFYPGGREEKRDCSCCVRMKE